MPEKARWFDMVSVSKFKKALQSIAGKAIQQSFFRFVNVAYLKNLLSCAGSFRNGGRYNLKNSFEVLYMAPDAQTAIEEAGLIDKFRLPPRILITLDVRLQSVLDLGERKIIEDSGIESERLFSTWRYPGDKESYTQTIGRLVYHSRRFEAIRYPSAKVRNKYNLAIFPERLKKSSVIKIYDPDKVIESILEGRE